MLKGSCLVSKGYTILCSPQPNYYIDFAEGQSTVIWRSHGILEGTCSEGQGYVQPISKLQSRNLATLAPFQIQSRAIARCPVVLVTVSTSR